MRLSIITLMALTLFISCNQQSLSLTDQHNSKNIHSSLSSSEKKFFVKVPSANELPMLEKIALNMPLNKWSHTVDNDVGFEMYYPAVYPENNPMILPGLSIYDSINNILIHTCSPQVLGTWDLSVKEMTVGNDKALWGRADYYDGSDNPGWEPNPETVCEGDIGGALYSFCSEKNGKTVVICFLQGTKDEALAESIFQTFRWTK